MSESKRRVTMVARLKAVKARDALLAGENLQVRSGREVRHLGGLGTLSSRDLVQMMPSETSS
jgi:hypothetical protein